MSEDKDAYVSNDESPTSYLGPTGAQIDYGPSSVIPFVESGQNIHKGVTEQEWSDLYAGSMDIFSNAVSFALDPLNWLISTGLTFLIDFIQPLEDLLSLVTGNAERIDAYAKKWTAMGDALGPLADATKQAATDHLIEWEGKDADAAKKRLVEFAEGIAATGAEAKDVGGLLTMYSKIMTALQQIIIGIMATLIEWMIIEWTAAMAAAVPTAGASVAAAGTATTVQATTATSRAVRFVDKVVTLLNKIGRMLQKILPKVLKDRVGSSVAEFSGSAATLSTLSRITGSVLADAPNYLGPYGNATTGLVKNDEEQGPDMTDEQIDDALDTGR